MRKVLSTLALCTAVASASAQLNISIDGNNRGPKISPTMYGIFFEDINHAADGGLYAELIQNRSFEDDPFAPLHWSANGGATIELTAESPLNQAHQKSLRVILNGTPASVANEGYWGINAVSGQKYKLSFWAKSDRGFKGTVIAQLQTKDGKSLGSSDIALNLTDKWTRYTTTITATGNDSKAEFVFKTSDKGVLQLDVVSLFPPTFKNRENGMRPDLAQMLYDMHPKFMRFPGGCFVEGQKSPENAFRWERTIGAIEDRPGHWNVNWGYRTTDGIGFHEYLQLAEDLGAKPLYVVNVGIWHGGYTPLDSIQPWIDECMNALEYANGPVTSKYGALRAKNGHPQPFNIEYLEIGNENYNFFIDNNKDQSINYPERYKKFYDAVKAKYPGMKCIGNVEAWATDNPSWRNSYPVDLLDEHYYRTPTWFAERFHKYDSYDRKGPKVYVGEYAVTSQFGKIGNLNAALGEAVYMMGMENNSDVVALCSYAPIFVNENNVAWAPDMIRFNSSECMGTPSYYVQQLFPANIGTQVLNTKYDYKLPERKAEVQDKPSHVGLATWNTNVRYENPVYIVDGKEVKLSGLDSWDKKKGRWSADGDAVTQTSPAEGAMLIAPEAFNNKKYTYKVRARKESGAEGFLVVFNYEDKDHYCWLNIGGWGNSQGTIEQACGNGTARAQLVPTQPTVVETGRWYDLQVDVDGDYIKAYLDGKLQFEAKIQRSFMEGIYASTTIDDAHKVAYIKVVNTGEGAVPATVSLSNLKAVSATLTRLSSASGDDENTMENPRTIIPVEAPVTVSGSKIKFDVPSYSVNIIKAKLK